MLLSQFDIDIAKCMYCGLCSEPCPTGSIHHTTEFEGADYSLESLIRRFVKDPVMAYKPKKGPETDPQNRADSQSRHDLPRSMGATRRREAGRRRRAGVSARRSATRGRANQMLAQVIFYALAALTVGSAMLVAFSRNIVYSTFALLGAFMGVVGIYILLAADFVAMVQLLVYVGGILVLTIFAVMLTAGIADVTVSNRAVGTGAGLCHGGNRRRW